MGTSIALSMNSLLKKNISRGKIVLKIFKRSIIIFALGLMLSNGHHHQQTGKHQLLKSRLFLVYFVVMNNINIFQTL